MLNIVAVFLLVIAMEPLETRVALLEQTAENTAKSIEEVKKTVQENQQLLIEIKDAVNPRLEGLTTWRDSHIREHDKAGERFRTTIAILVSLLAIIAATPCFQHFFKWRNRVGKHAGKS